MRKQRKQMESLFNPLYYKEWPSLSTLFRSAEKCDELEINVFSAGLEDEAAFDSKAGSGGVAGPLTIKLNDEKIDLSLLGQSFFTIPQWVESDSLEFTRCKAKGILVVEKFSVASRLMQYEPMRELNLVIVGSGGFPLVRTRRFLHRLTEQTGLPVYLLTDNDTWGYFIFSMLKRGMFAPNDSCKFLSVDDVRFLGLRAGESGDFGTPERALIKWKDRWDTRLKHMQKYPCFQSPEWKREFAAFKRQKAKFELDAALGLAGPDKLINYVQRRIECKQWLT